MRRLWIRSDLSPASYLSRRSLFVADGARRLTRPPPISYNVEPPIAHAITIQQLFVDYVTTTPPSNWSDQQRNYAVQLLEAYDAAVMLIDDEEMREIFKQALANPS